MKTKKHGDKNTTYVSVSESKLWPSISRVCLLADDKRVTPTSTQPIGAGFTCDPTFLQGGLQPKKNQKDNHFVHMIRPQCSLSIWFSHHIVMIIGVLNTFCLTVRVSVACCMLSTLQRVGLRYVPLAARVSMFGSEQARSKYCSMAFGKAPERRPGLSAPDEP